MKNWHAQQILDTIDSHSRFESDEVIPESTHQETFNALREASRTIAELQEALTASETERNDVIEALRVFLKTGDRDSLLERLNRSEGAFDKLGDQN